MWARHIGGTWSWLEVRLVNLLEAPNVGGVVVALRDMTERRAVEDELRHNAFHDPLTGLPNRALLADRIDQAVLRGRRGDEVAVLFIDLDNFKTINDTLGRDDRLPGHHRLRTRSRLGQHRHRRRNDR
jgi:PleD family two-component response regulator